MKVITRDSVDAAEVQRHMSANAPNKSTDAGLPRFTIVGKDHQFYLGLGIQFLGEAAYTWGGTTQSTLDFVPADISRGPNELGFAWQTSSFYVNILALPQTANTIGLFFKANYTGDGNAFHVSHLYAKYRGLTVGRTHSLFTDGAAIPVTIDDEGPNGVPSITLFTAYWEQQFGHGLSAAAGIDASTDYYTARSGTESKNQPAPAIPLYLQYAWDGGESHVRLSGLIRPMRFTNSDFDKRFSLTGWGLQLSGITNLYGPLSACYNLVYGNGIGHYINDDSGLYLDAVQVQTSELKSMRMVKNLGLTAGVTYEFTPKLKSNVTYSHLTNWMPQGAVVDADSYRYGDYVAANLIYNVNEFLTAGIEYDYGFRKSLGGTRSHANRIQVQMAVTF